MPPETTFAVQWLRKARGDLRAAQAIIDSVAGMTDVPCFHAQQCVEKALKGFLCARGAEFARTHDLMMLLGQVVTLDSSFLTFKDLCAELCEFAVVIRYPGDFSEPDEAETRQYIAAAQTVLEKVCTALCVSVD
jgi:HEPN domain-containing protein